MAGELNARYWEERYTAGDTPWDIGAASKPITTYLDGLEDRGLRILIPGAGRAYEAEYAHRAGFSEVFAMDLTDEALKDLRQRCPSFPVEHVLVGDLFTHEGSYDIIIEQTLLCALEPSQRERYVDTMQRLLKPGGVLVGVLFDQVPNAQGPPFAASVEDYQQLFAKQFPDARFERCHNSIAPRAGRELWVKAVRHGPASCAIHDGIEAAATLREEVTLVLTDGSERTSVPLDIIHRDGADLVVLRDGTEVAIDRVREVVRERMP
ncbi:MAG TPA: methyltransferase domain-containing protein [Flavobacteriales bacterium]|nr:methyltransferase domain-containing protein [Flavobacteriales bacterium]